VEAEGEGSGSKEMKITHILVPEEGDEGREAVGVPESGPTLSVTHTGDEGREGQALDRGELGGEEREETLHTCSGERQQWQGRYCKCVVSYLWALYIY
jgi:hypothetical protein